MKKIIWILGIIFLSIIIVLNLLFTTNLDSSEHATVEFNNVVYVIGLIVAGLVLFLFTRFINEYLYKDYESKKKLRKYLFIGAIILYIIFCIVWVVLVNPYVVGDSVHVCNLAQTFYRGDLEEFLPDMTYLGVPLRDYMQAYPQQITLSFVYSLFFRLIHFDVMEVLRALNIISIILIVFSVYKIGNQLSKTYKTNKVLLLTLILTFISLPMLETFIYGDIPSLALCLLAVYFMMKFTETKKIRYPIFASIFTMIAYMMRMNSLIFIIATVIYLLMNLFKEITKKKAKENILNISIIVIYLVISILPTTIVQNYFYDAYELDKSKIYPKISYVYMAMEEGPRGNGWYSEDIAVHAIKNPENIQEEYTEKIKSRLDYFAKNPGYTFNFYVTKIASMWTENTYSAVRNNTKQESNDPLENIIGPLTFYQKVLLIITCVCTLIVLIQNRKNLSMDLIFLLTIFVGGFAFHILWEAKSRYIIPYIIVLIPIASIWINKFKIIDKMKNLVNSKLNKKEKVM